MKTKEWNDFVERYVHSEEMATELKAAFDAEIKEAIAEHEAAMFPEANEKDKANGWMLDFQFIKQISDRTQIDDREECYPVDMEETESVLIALRDRNKPLPEPQEGGEG